MQTAILGLDTEELRTLAELEGEPLYRGDQIARWMYHHGVHSFDEMTNLNTELRTRLSERYEVGRLHVVTIRQSSNGVLKLLLEAHDGVRVETVGLPYEGRYSCCVSTQAGCPIGCIFCATGLSGYVRNLTAGEIVDQVLAVQEAVRNSHMQNNDPDFRIDHIIFMGMGEPLLNYAATMKAIHLLNEEMDISMRHITLSTVGLVPRIRSLAKEKLQINLAISLHAPTDNLRRRLVPGMVKWSIAEIIDTCHKYTQQTGRRVTYEYCLLDGVNDGNTQARELAGLLHGMNCHVNIIPYNPVSELNFQSPPPKRVRAFCKILRADGIEVTQRLRRGVDIDAACGQLRQRFKEEIPVENHSGL